MPILESVAARLPLAPRMINAVTPAGYFSLLTDVPVRARYPLAVGLCVGYPLWIVVCILGLVSYALMFLIAWAFFALLDVWLKSLRK